MTRQKYIDEATSSNSKKSGIPAFHKSYVDLDIPRYQWLTGEIKNRRLGNVFDPTNEKEIRVTRRVRSNLPPAKVSNTTPFSSFNAEKNISNSTLSKYRFRKHIIIQLLGICNKISTELQTEHLELENISGMPLQTTLALNYYLDGHVKLPLVEVSYNLRRLFPIIVDLQDIRLEFLSIQEFDKQLEHWATEFIEAEK